MSENQGKGPILDEPKDCIPATALAFVLLVIGLQYRCRKELTKCQLKSLISQHDPK